MHVDKGDETSHYARALGRSCDIVQAVGFQLFVATFQWSLGVDVAFLQREGTSKIGSEEAIYCVKRPERSSASLLLQLWKLGLRE